MTLLGWLKPRKKWNTKKPVAAPAAPTQAPHPAIRPYPSFVPRPVSDDYDDRRRQDEQNANAAMLTTLWTPPADASPSPSSACDTSSSYDSGFGD